MPCLLVFLVLLFPRVAIVLLYFFTHFFAGVYDNLIVPLIGFIVFPLTLLAYTYFAKTHHPTDTVFLVVMILAVVMDLGLLGGGYRSRRP